MASGGKREGSGRKAIHPSEKRVQMSVSVSPETKERLASLRQEGNVIGKLIDQWTEDFCNLAK